ncbi:MAG TPA: type I glutamate--ammonia ligase [Candidatus Wallbacteria bacterium]|nr:MAG: Glutamine synthetase 1 [bacterium ADurb.Bin243]HPG57248.1 type I glutamate--ammonia ligase [Candidatus Wallbacteria bacterium]
MFSSARELIKFINNSKIDMLDFKATDLRGKLRHITIPACRVTEKMLEEGVGIDGYSYGFVNIEKSDMVLIPDIKTAFIDPFYDTPTVSVFSNIWSVEGDECHHPQCPRNIAKKAEKFVTESKTGDNILLGPEYEFYVFDNVEYLNEARGSSYSIFTKSQPLTSDPAKYDGYKMAAKGGYHACNPQDSLYEFRSQAALLLEKCGVAVKYHHHEVGGAGQVEIETAFDSISKMADATMLVKYIVFNLAKKMGKTATFMPKPIYGEAGSGLHVHFKLLEDGKNLFYDAKGYSGMSKTALNFIGGILKHAGALTAFANPSTNSYKRLVPGFEAPTCIAFATSNRSAAIRIPGYVKSMEDKRFEYRPQDATCNPYLSFAALVMAGIDGIDSKIDPSKSGYGPFDVNLYELPEAEQKKLKFLPQSLAEALKELKSDNAFLNKGGVFPKALVDNWVSIKTKEDVLPMQNRPHPYEFELYYGL